MDKSGLNKKERNDMVKWHINEGVAFPPEKESGAAGNLYALKHGIFANKILTPDEKELFDVLIEKLYGDFQFNRSSDFLQVELVGVYSVKLMRAQVEGNADAAEKLDRMIRAHMRELKTTKIAREGEQPQKSQTSPAEWASALLDKAAEVTEKTKDRKKANRKNAKKTADNTEELETESPE